MCELNLVIPTVDLDISVATDTFVTILLLFVRVGNIYVFPKHLLNELLLGGIAYQLKLLILVHSTDSNVALN